MHKTIGERLQYLRESKKPVRSRRVTSELLGMSHDTLRNYERNVTKPTADALILLSEYYQVNTDYLLLLTDYKWR